MTQRFMNAAALVMLPLILIIALACSHYIKVSDVALAKTMLAFWAAYLFCLAGALVSRVVEWKRGQE